MREPTQAETGASRHSVLAVLRRQPDPMDINQLAREVGLSVNTVRFHLDHLIGGGLVTASRAPARRPGRPKRLYRALPAEAVDGEAAYRLLAGLLADELVRSGDTETALVAGRRWAEALDLTTPRADDASQTTSPLARMIRRIVDLFSEGGFAPEWDASNATITLHRCPFMDLATVRPEVVCGVHLGLVRGLIDRVNQGSVPRGDEAAFTLWSRQVLLRPVLDGTGPCEVRLQATCRLAAG